MVIDITKLTEKTPVDFSFSSEIKLSPNFNLSKHSVTVSFAGTLSKLGDVYTCNGTIQAGLTFLCDYCLTDAPHKLSFSVSEKFKKTTTLPTDLADLDELVEWLTANKIDITPLCVTSLYANMPMQVLCKEDCKGLCTSCGTSLNEQTCNCSQATGTAKKTDPRFELLKTISFKEE